MQGYGGGKESHPGSQGDGKKGKAVAGQFLPLTEKENPRNAFRGFILDLRIY